MGFDVRRGRTGEHNRLVRVVSARAHAAADSGTRPASNATGGQRAPPAGVRVGGGAASARAQQWLLIEWPKTEPKPVHYWLCTLPPDTRMKSLVATAMGRWRIERDYQELKSELGLHHYEGRNWRGFHHHGSLCIAAYGF